MWRVRVETGSKIKFEHFTINPAAQRNPADHAVRQNSISLREANQTAAIFPVNQSEQRRKGEPFENF